MRWFRVKEAARRWAPEVWLRVDRVRHSGKGLLAGVRDALADILEATLDTHEWLVTRDHGTTEWACQNCAAAVTLPGGAAHMPSVSMMERLGVGPDCHEEAVRRVMES